MDDLRWPSVGRLHRRSGRLQSQDCEDELVGEVVDHGKVVASQPNIPSTKNILPPFLIVSAYYTLSAKKQACFR